MLPETLFPPVRARWTPLPPTQNKSIPARNACATLHCVFILIRKFPLGPNILPLPMGANLPLLPLTQTAPVLQNVWTGPKQALHELQIDSPLTGRHINLVWKAKVLPATPPQVLLLGPLQRCFLLSAPRPVAPHTKRLQCLVSTTPSPLSNLIKLRRQNLRANAPRVAINSKGVLT